MKRVAYYKGCLASLSAKELDTATQALAPKVGLELVELEIRRILHFAGATETNAEFELPVDQLLLNGGVVGAGRIGACCPCRGKQQLLPLNGWLGRRKGNVGNRRPLHRIGRIGGLLPLLTGGGEEQNGDKSGGSWVFDRGHREGDSTLKGGKVHPRLGQSPLIGKRMSPGIAENS